MHTLLLVSILITGAIAPLMASGAQVPKGKYVIGYVQDYSFAPADLDQIDFKKLTDLNVAFANPMDADGTLSVPPNLAAIVSRAHENGVKVLISIGGGGVSTNDKERAKYFALISDKNRKAFVQRIADYLDANHLDGIDVDLEGPAINNDYASFVEDLAHSVKPKGQLLTAALSAWFGGDQVTAKALSNFDIVNVMAYDATGPWEPSKPGQHSSLDFAKTSISYWEGRGVPKSKLVLGVPFYGYGFGDAFTQDGYKFAQIIGKYPGAENSDQVGSTIWYNGIPTIRAKVDYAMKEGLAGIMIWSIDQDVKGKLSLLSAIQDSLKASSSPSHYHS